MRYDAMIWGHVDYLFVGQALKCNVGLLTGSSERESKPENAI